jgi:hypothetical protein
VQDVARSNARIDARTQPLAPIGADGTAGAGTGLTAGHDLGPPSAARSE